MESDKFSVCNEKADDFSPAIDTSEDNENSDYYFESDPLALQLDTDYQKLLRTLVKLQAQRVQAVQDLERIQHIREEGLKDPIKFVNDLLNGQHQDLPGPIKIEPLPIIDIDKYNVENIVHNIKPKTRKQKQGNSPPDSSDDERECKSKDKILIRGREYNDSKPLTFNQPWTDEEQRRLDELLIKYPDEKIASQRYLKISKELGTRTVVQVQSRVQKYFLALKREGLPVPGRAPSTALLRKQSRKRNYANTNSVESSCISSYMKVYNFDTSSSSHASQSTLPLSSYRLPDVSDDEEISDDLRNLSQYKEIIRRKRVKKMKLEETATGIVRHPGFSCDVCHQDPIVGTRWHCLECPTETNTDFCSNCVKSNYLNNTHLPTHVLKPIEALNINDTLIWLRETEL